MSSIEKDSRNTPEKRKKPGEDCLGYIPILLLFRLDVGSPALLLSGEFLDMLFIYFALDRRLVSLINVSMLLLVCALHL